MDRFLEACDPIVDAIARAHGGSAAVTSEVGRGSTFPLTLPA